VGITELWDAFYTAIFMFLKKRMANQTVALILAIFLSFLIPAFLVFLVWIGVQVFLK